MTEEIKAFKEKETYTPEDIRELVAILRSPDGCAWDREQTHKSVRNAMIEETYEFIEGLDKDDKTLMKEELGDVLFQVFFHARIAEESGEFSIDDIADEICKKMVLRHPHAHPCRKIAVALQKREHSRRARRAEVNFTHCGKSTEVNAGDRQHADRRAFVCHHQFNVCLKNQRRASVIRNQQPFYRRNGEKS